MEKKIRDQGNGIQLKSNSYNQVTVLKIPKDFSYCFSQKGRDSHVGGPRIPGEAILYGGAPMGGEDLYISNICQAYSSLHGEKEAMG